MRAYQQFLKSQVHHSDEKKTESNALVPSMGGDDSKLLPRESKNYVREEPWKHRYLNESSKMIDEPQTLLDQFIYYSLR
jgi:hypothetical protein